MAEALPQLRETRQVWPTQPESLTTGHTDHVCGNAPGRDPDAPERIVAQPNIFGVDQDPTPSRTLFIGGMTIPAGDDPNLARFTWGQIVARSSRGERLRHPTRGHPGLLRPPGRTAHRGGEVLLGGTGWSPDTVDTRTLLSSSTSPGEVRPDGSSRIDIRPGAAGSASWAHLFRYRSTVLRVDSRFLHPYYADLDGLDAIYTELDDRGGALAVHEAASNGLVSSVQDTIDHYWSKLLARTPQWDHYERLVGCYNLPRGGPALTSLYGFWRFRQGAPWMVHLWTAQMLNVFSDYIDYDDGSTVLPSDPGRPEKAPNECIGMGRFVRRLLRRPSGRAPNRHDEKRCRLTVDYRNRDPRWPRQLHDESCGRAEAALSGDSPCESWDCTVGFEKVCERPHINRDCYGFSWDEWPMGSFNEARGCWNGAESTCEAPLDLCSGSAYQRMWSINLHPSELAYQAQVVDHCMWLARLALDYARWLTARDRYLEADIARAAGREFSAYALIVLTYNAAHWLHEIGHTWLGQTRETWQWNGSHCEYNCCHDIVRQHFICKVRAEMGLPLQEYRSPRGYNPPTTTGGDFTLERDQFTDVKFTHCSGDEPRLQVNLAYSCFVEQPGVPGSESHFCSSGCVYEASVFGQRRAYAPDLQSYESRDYWESVCSASAARLHLAVS